MSLAEQPSFIFHSAAPLNMSGITPPRILRRFFISCVTREFGCYREPLRKELTGAIEEAKVQEDFANGPGTLLEKLDDYIKQSSAVLHILGKSAGARARPAEVRAILARHPDFTQVLPALVELSNPDACCYTYTQWECYLAIYHRVPCFIYVAGDASVHESGWIEDADEVRSQEEHFSRLEALGQDRMTIPNMNTDKLALSFRKGFDNHVSGATFAEETFDPSLIQWPATLPPRRCRVADRDPEFQLFRSMLSADSPVRILLFHGPSDRGKSMLMAEFDDFGRQVPGIACARVEFKGSPPLRDVLCELAGELQGIRFARFERAKLTQSEALRMAFLEDVGEARKPVILLLDTYEAASDEAQLWIEQNLFGLVRRVVGLRVVMTGKTVPALEPGAKWAALAESHELPPISDAAHWCRYVREILRIMNVPDDHIRTLVMAAKGSPRVLASLLANLRDFEPA